MQQQLRIVGVDVAKAQLVMADHSAVASGTVVANQGAAISSWLKGLAPGSIVAMEATGSHHRLLAQLAHAAGMRVFVLNARDVHFYAKALGARGKTDRLDAAVIARYVAEHHSRLHAWQPAAGVEQQLHDLLKRRAHVSRMSGSLRQTLSDAPPSLRMAGRRLHEHIDVFLEEIDRQLVALVDSDPTLSQGVALVRSVPGYGPQGSVALAALFSRLPFANGNAVVAYTGLDPRPCDSGTHKGKRRLSKRGPAWLRRQVYLAALGASHSKALKPLYESIKARGFAPTQALVILARKLLRVAFAVWRSQRPFDPAQFALVAL
jgi:transposase